MKRLKLSFAVVWLLLIATVLFSCQKDPPPEQLSGTWEVTFDGTCAGTQEIVVNDDGSFSFTVNCGAYVYTLKGTVDLVTGKLTGNVAWGPFGCSNALTGHLNQTKTGSGTVDCLAIQVGWTAKKR